MNIKEILKKRMTLSFEVFPPKADKTLDTLADSLAHLYQLGPDFISCTYGAGGSNVGRNREICQMIQESHQAVAIPHFTCIGNNEATIKEQLEYYRSINIEHILALRGDYPKGWEGTGGDFNYANELVRYIRKTYDDQFTIGVAANPEKHIQSKNMKAEIAHFKVKVEAGADYAVTQLCFDMDQFKRWKDQVRVAGVNIPIIVGIMPITNKNGLIRMTIENNGCSIPRQVSEIISKYGDNPEDFKKAGLDYTVSQIYDYIDEGVEGIHIYALNQWKTATTLCETTGIQR